MKRTIASLVSVITLLSISSTAFAYGYSTTNNQPRPSRRWLAANSVANYRTRGFDRTMARARYMALVALVLRATPAYLAVTGGGGRTRSDYLTADRPSTRTAGSPEWRNYEVKCKDGEQRNALSPKVHCSSSNK